MENTSWRVVTATQSDSLYSEMEGVSMIITTYGLIIFPLVVWIGVIVSKTSKEEERYGTDMLGFAYPAIPSRHEVPGKTLPAI